MDVRKFMRSDPNGVTAMLRDCAAKCLGPVKPLANVNC